MQMRSPSRTHSRTLREKISIWRLKCSTGRHSKTNESSTGGTQASGVSIAPGTAALRCARAAELVQRRMRRAISASSASPTCDSSTEVAGLDVGEQHVLFARAFFVERVATARSSPVRRARRSPGRSSRRPSRVRRTRAAATSRGRRCALDKASTRVAHRRAVEAFEDALAHAPRAESPPTARCRAGARVRVLRCDSRSKRAHAIRSRRRRTRRAPARRRVAGEDVEDAAAHGVFADRADDVGTRVAEAIEPLLQRVPIPGLVADAQREAQFVEAAHAA